MKICIVHRYPASLVIGTNPSFPVLINKLIEDGHDVSYVSFKEPNPNNILDEVHYNPLKIVYKREKTFDKIFKNLYFILMIPLIISILHSNKKFDLIYCDDSIPVYGFLIKLFVNTKVVIRLGDLQSAYMLADQSRIKDILFKIVFSIEKFMWNKVDGLVAISKPFKDFLIKNGIEPKKVYVVQECIDLDLFNPIAFKKEDNIRSEYNIAPEDPLIMFHGVVVPCKGLDTLLKAIPIVIKKKPNAKFMIVGDGSSLNGLKHLTNELRLNNSLIFTGWHSFEEMPIYLNSCDLGIAMRSGNLGNNFVVTTALLQYWALNKPVIAPRLNAMMLHVKNMENGLFFEPDNPKDLAEKILYLIDHPMEAKEMGMKGRVTDKLKEVIVDAIKKE